MMALLLKGLLKSSLSDLKMIVGWLLKDFPRFRPPPELPGNLLKALLKGDSWQTTHELAEKIDCNHRAIVKCFKSLGLHNLGLGYPVKSLNPTA